MAPKTTAHTAQGETASNVSVVLCTYNGARYLRDQLDSILSQSVAPAEMVVVDDASTDDTVAILEHYSRCNPMTKWTLVCNERNLGWRENYFEAIKLATCDYICLSDQDDIWRPNHIEVLIGALEDTGGEMVYSRALPFYEDGSLYCNSGEAISGTGRCCIKPYAVSILDMKAPGCTYCFTRSFFGRISKYWNVACAHDRILYAFANVSETLCELDCVTVDFRRHSSNASDFRYKGRSDLNQELDALIALYEGLESYVEEAELVSGSGDKAIEQHAFIKWLEKRKGIVNKGNPLGWISLIPDAHNYPTKANLFADLWCTMFANKKLDRYFFKKSNSEHV